VTDQPRVLILCSDLFFATQLRSAAEAAGYATDMALSINAVATKLAEASCDVVIVDLELGNLDMPALLATLRDPRPRVIAFGPHVQEARLAAARAAGCDEVLTRGQIASQLTSKLIADS